WRLSTRSNRTAADRMRERLATSTSPATWIHASRYGRSWFRTAPRMSRPGQGSWRIAYQLRSMRKRSTKRAACSRRLKSHKSEPATSRVGALSTRSLERPHCDRVLVFDVNRVSGGYWIGVRSAFGDFVASQFFVGFTLRLEGDELTCGREAEE